MYFDVSRGKLNGVFKYLYKKYSAEYSNIVIANGSDAHHNNERDPMGTLIPDSKLYFVSCKNDYNVYLLKHYVHIVHYSIKHHNTAIRMLSKWKLQGSIDGSAWKSLSEVNECDENCKNESIHSYSSKEGTYNAFRVLKMNSNSDNSCYYDLYKFELFGSLCLTKDCKIPLIKFPTKRHRKGNRCIYLLIAILISRKK